HLLPRFCVWSNRGGTLRPLREPGELLPDCMQLWVHRDGASPWLLDLGLTPHDGDTWVSKRADPAPAGEGAVRGGRRAVPPAGGRPAHERPAGPREGRRRLRGVAAAARRGGAGLAAGRP